MTLTAGACIYWILIDRGFQPDINISDQASGLKKAFEDVLPKTELRFDHFHMIKASKELIRFLKNRKASATTRAIVLYARPEKAQKKGKDHPLSDQLAMANKTMAAAQMRYMSASTSYAPGSNTMSFNSQATALRSGKDSSTSSSMSCSRSLMNLGYRPMSGHSSTRKKTCWQSLTVWTNNFRASPKEYGVSLHDIWSIAYTARFDIQAPTYHVHSEKLESRIGLPQYDQIEDDVLTVLASTHRCSSMVENFNSRLKPYLDARKTITGKILGLYQFILNHRPFQRSHHPRLVGKTPAEALTGKSHPHWLELLGYQRFQRTALAA